MDGESEDVVTDPLIDRLHAHVRECGKRYPQAWRQMDQFRDGRGRNGLDDWPGWCFCPVSASYAIVTTEHGFNAIDERHDRVMVTEEGMLMMQDVARVAALGPWRVSQGIYRIDDTVRQAVIETPAAGAVPVDVLLSLPEWCVYVPMPGHDYVGAETRGGKTARINGFFAHLEHDTHDGRAELRLLIDFADEPVFTGLHVDIIHLLRGKTLIECYDAMRAVSKHQMLKIGARRDHLDEAIDNLRQTAVERLAPVVSVLLYLCSQTAEFRQAGEVISRRPGNPEYTKTKKGWRLFPPDRPKIWHVGERLGKAIRDAQAADHPRQHGDDRAGPRPHVRRAHWHSFWTGAKDAVRKIVLKWLPPIPVAMEEDTAQARMRHAKLKPVRNLDSQLDTLASELETHHDSASHDHGTATAARADGPVD